MGAGRWMYLLPPAIVLASLVASCSPSTHQTEPSATPTPILTATAESDPIKVAQAGVVMVVVSKSGKPVATGSGLVVFDRRHVLTNLHVAAAGDSYEVMLAPPGIARVSTTALLLDFDEKRDLALLRLKEALGSPIQVADALPMLGEQIVIAGYPGVGGTTLTITKGSVSGFFDIGDGLGDAWIKTDAAINRGNSGGAALDAVGRVVGVPTFLIRNGNDSLAYILSIREATSFLASGVGRTEPRSIVASVTAPSAASAEPRPPATAPPASTSAATGTAPTSTPSTPPVVSAPRPIATPDGRYRTSTDIYAFLKQIQVVTRQIGDAFSAANSTGNYRDYAPVVQGYKPSADYLKQQIASYQNQSKSIAACQRAQSNASLAAGYLGLYASYLSLEFSVFPNRTYTAQTEESWRLYNQSLSDANDAAYACGTTP